MRTPSANTKKSARIVIPGPGVVAGRRLVRVRKNETASFDGPAFSPLSLAPDVPRKPVAPPSKELGVQGKSRSTFSQIVHSGYASFLAAVLLLLASAMFLTWTHTEQRRLGFEISTMQKQEKRLMQETQELLADIHDLAPLDKVETEALGYGMRVPDPAKVITLPKERMIN